MLENALANNVPGEVLSNVCHSFGNLSDKIKPLGLHFEVRFWN